LLGAFAVAAAAWAGKEVFKPLLTDATKNQIKKLLKQKPQQQLATLTFYAVCRAQKELQWVPEAKALEAIVKWVREVKSPISWAEWEQKVLPAVFTEITLDVQTLSSWRHLISDMLTGDLKEKFLVDLIQQIQVEQQAHIADTKDDHARLEEKIGSFGDILEEINCNVSQLRPTVASSDRDSVRAAAVEIAARQSVFISYNHIQSEQADEVEVSLSEYVAIIRDKNAVLDGESFSEFMKRIRHEDFAVLLISDEYLRSINCMYEVSQLVKDEGWSKRVRFFIFDNAASIYDPRKQPEYFKYWEQYRAELEKDLNETPPQSQEGLIKEYVKVAEIQSSIGQFLSIVRDTKNAKDIGAFTNSLLRMLGIEVEQPCSPVEEDGASAIYDLADGYYNEGEYEAAYNVIKDLFHDKDARALNYVGVMYYYGYCFDADRYRAFELFKESAEAGYPAAMRNLGNHYFYGDYVDKNEPEGVAWYRKAATADPPNPSACYLLAQALQSGRGTTRDIEEAALWYERAGDIPEAMYQLGMLYLFEPTFQQQQEKALHLIFDAADKEHEDAKKFLEAFEKAKEICSLPTPVHGSFARNALIAALHKSMQAEVEIPLEERYKYVQEFSASAMAISRSVTVKQMSIYLLLLAHVIYLCKEAPHDEQNICMIVELLEAGILGDNDLKSDADRLYDLLRDKGEEHFALLIYDQYLVLTGSYASQIAKECRSLFPEIGPSNDVFCNASSCADAEILADILSYSFQATGTDNLEKWTEENAARMLAFRLDLVINYLKLNGKTTGISYEQLLDSLSEPFSKAAIKGCIHFYHEFDDPKPEKPKTKEKTHAESKPKANPKTESESEQDENTVKIPVVELFDENGESIVFELLDTIRYQGDKYTLLTPYYETEEEYDLDNPADVFVMKEVTNEEDEPMLETVEDNQLLQTVYSLFKKAHDDEFEFRDS